MGRKALREVWLWGSLIVSTLAAIVVLRAVGVDETLSVFLAIFLVSLLGPTGYLGRQVWRRSNRRDTG
jgi:Na+/H+-dicarboxylate symporter